MKIESLEEALMINALTGLPLKVMITEKMITEDFKMTQEQYDRGSGEIIDGKNIDSRSIE